VRFSSQTRYCLLDIDAGSVYHPQADAFAIGRMLAALEPLGFTAYLACQSSYRGGIHLYLPFQDAQTSWDLAACVAALLENAGFRLRAGQLELFPNPKPFSTTRKRTLFNAHRLPMQAGSYLLDHDFQPVWSDRSRFVQQWRFIQSCNVISTRVLRQLLKQNRRKHYRISGKADKFLNDLDTEIEQGWTGFGQTNRLLGRIALRTYIFHHVLHGSEPLTGQALVDQIVSIAKFLPGYQEWCRHQHEIEHRAAEWASCAENSHYFHYTHRSAAQTLSNKSFSSQTVFDQLPSWNQQQSETTREKIRRAIADLLEKNSLPAKATARFQALLHYEIGGGSLYRHRDLWHPNYFDFEANASSNHADDLSHDSVENGSFVENPPHPPTSFSARPPDQREDRSDGLSCTSLFPCNGGNVLPAEASGDRLPDQPHLSDSFEHQYRFRMQQYLDSNDPILIAEAKTWQHFRQNDQFPESPIASQDSLQASEDHNSAQISSECVLPFAKLSTLKLLNSCNSLKLKSIAVSSISDSLQHSFNSPPNDLSNLLVAISVELRRLQWNSDQICDRLWQRYGKTSRALLTECELSDWFTWLQTQ